MRTDEYQRDYLVWVLLRNVVDSPLIWCAWQRSLVMGDVR